MKSKLTSFVLIVTCTIQIIGCDDGANGKRAEQQQANIHLNDENRRLSGEIQILKDKLATLETENQALSNTPERRLSHINELVEKQNESEAAEAITLLEKNYPHSPEVEKANTLMAGLQSKLREEREAAERKERLGFKVLKEVKGFNAARIKISVSPPQISGRWTFDSYGDNYHYRDAERGNRYVTARVSITAEKEEKNPSLPGFGVYEVNGNKLKLVADLTYEFVRWEDYGTYLGNSADFQNDFAHTETIPFTVGVEVSDEKLKLPTFLIAARSNCYRRDFDRFKNPPVSYSGTCREIKPELSLDEATSKDYFVLKVWNGTKL